MCVRVRASDTRRQWFSRRGRDTRARDLCSSGLYIGGRFLRDRYHRRGSRHDRRQSRSRRRLWYDDQNPSESQIPLVPDHTAVSAPPPPPSPAAADRDGCCGSHADTLPNATAAVSRSRVIHGSCAHGTSGFAYTLANVRRIRAERGPANSDHVRLMRPLISPITRGVNNILFFPCTTCMRENAVGPEKKITFSFRSDIAFRPHSIYRLFFCFPLPPPRFYHISVHRCIYIIYDMIHAIYVIYIYSIFV